MTAKGTEFLDDWIVGNVTAKDTSDERVTELALLCIAAATRQGISIADMQEDGPCIEEIIMDIATNLEERETPDD